jgi:ferrous iron transport protein B
MAIFSAYILNIILKIKCKTFFVVEMPSYKLSVQNVALMLLKTKAFVLVQENNFSYINRAMVYGFYGPGNSITQKLYSFQKRKMQEYHKRN